MWRRVLTLSILIICCSAATRAERHWLVVSDLHVLPAADVGTPSGRGSDSNWALFASALKAMRAADPQPDAVVIAGDFLAHHFNGDAKATMARIAHAFATTFPRAQFFVTLGNNDDPCGDYRTSTRSPYLSAVARIWEPLVNRNGAAPDFVRDFSRGGYYSARVAGTKLRVLVLNSVYWSTFYRGCGGPLAAPGDAEFAWLERALARPGSKIVLMHIPPGVDVMSTLLLRRFVVLSFLQDAATRRFISDVSAPRSGVHGVLAGHVHSGGYRLFGGIPIVIAPSISPIYGNDPEFLQLRVRSGGVVADAFLYAYNYRTGRWSKRFDFDRVFGAAAFDAKDLAQLSGRVALSANVRRLWQQFYNIPPESRWQAYWCAQETYGGTYVACTGDSARVAAFPWLAGLAAALVIAVLAWCGMLGTRWIRRRRSA